MYSLLRGLAFVCIAGSVAFASPKSVSMKWTPDQGNTLTADKFVVSRQSNQTGGYTTVCEATPDQPVCQDEVSVGTHCWKAQVFAGSVGGPESQPVCQDVSDQFTGTLVIEITGSGTISINTDAKPASRNLKKKK